MIKVSCPRAQLRSVDLLPPGIKQFLGATLRVRSWFNFWKMPRSSVRASIEDPGEDKYELEEAFAVVENEIEKMVAEGIPSRNIIVAGMSQVSIFSLGTL